MEIFGSIAAFLKNIPGLPKPRGNITFWIHQDTGERLVKIEHPDLKAYNWPLGEWVGTEKGEELNAFQVRDWTQGCYSFEGRMNRYQADALIRSVVDPRSLRSDNA